MFGINPRIYSIPSHTGLFLFYVYASYEASKLEQTYFTWFFLSCLAIHSVSFMISWARQGGLVITFWSDLLTAIVLMVGGSILKFATGSATFTNNSHKAAIESTGPDVSSEYFPGVVDQLDRANAYLGTISDWAGAALMAPNDNPFGFVLLSTSFSMLCGGTAVALTLICLWIDNK